MENLFLRPKPIEFGSREALTRFLDSVDAMDDVSCSLPVDVGSAEWVGVSTPSVSTSSSDEERDCNISVIDTRIQSRDTHSCFCCLSCEKVLGTEKQKSDVDLATQWARIQFKEQPREEINRVPEGCQEESVTISPECENETGIYTSEPLLLDPPDNQKPASLCSDCGASLLSAKSFVSPPGFCEYSGRLICGHCFEPRQVVVPWKLVRGMDSFRGSVSRKAASLIQADFYSATVTLDEIKERMIESPRGCLIIQKCDGFRKTVVLAKSGGTTCVGWEIATVISQLPAHIRADQTVRETELYSLADLIDLLAKGRDSVILTALAKCSEIIKSHACSECLSTCLVCDRAVSMLDPSFFECGFCSSTFHLKCFAWSPDGCPTCASRLETPVLLHADDSLDSL